MDIQPIAHAHNGFCDKFGIPRQSREESQIETRIVFESSFAQAEALRGIEDYSHLWLIWGFDKAEGWSPTVRPPRLGGNKRMGVFATRSPFRPNPLGLSSVRLLRMEKNSHTHTLELVVAGADLLDGTPIYDIKPYLSFSDSHPDAVNGFAAATQDYHLQVRGWDEWSTAAGLPCEDRAAIEEILRQDPRPAYQEDPDRVYKLDYGNWKVEFCVEGDVLWVKNCQHNKE